MLFDILLYLIHRNIIKFVIKLFYNFLLHIIFLNLSRNIFLMGAGRYRTLLIFLSPPVALASSLASCLAAYRFYVLCHVQPWIGRVFHPRTGHIIVRLFPRRYQVKVQTEWTRKCDEIWQITIILRVSAVCMNMISLPYFRNYMKSVISPSLIFVTDKRRPNGTLMKEATLIQVVSTRCSLDFEFTLPHVAYRVTIARMEYYRGLSWN